MAMTAEQMIAFHHERAERKTQFLEASKASSNLDHAAFLIRGAFRDRVMEGLIRWRTDMGSPVAAIRGAVQWVRESVDILRSEHGATMESEIVLVNASILCFLVNETPIAFDTSVLKMDCLLDAAFSRALRDQWDDAMWAQGIAELQNETRCALCIETYSTYHRLLRNEGGDVEKLVERATALFEKRRDDEFYIGGPQTEGGDLDNTVTVDYRLAAALKKLSYNNENQHRWRWE